MVRSNKYYTLNLLDKFSVSYIAYSASQNIYYTTKYPGIRTKFVTKGMAIQAYHSIIKRHSWMNQPEKAFPLKNVVIITHKEFDDGV